MRLSFALLALSTVFATVSAQSIPNCALQCISTADLDGCAATDNVCLCKNQKFVQSSTACIQQKCTGSDLTNAEAAARTLCAAVGVTLSAPSSTGTAPPASGATGAAASPSPSKGAASSNGVNALVGAAALFGAIAL